MVGNILYENDILPCFHYLLVFLEPDALLLERLRLDNTAYGLITVHEYKGIQWRKCAVIQDASRGWSLEQSM
jgi:hypothetical protein